MSLQRFFLSYLASPFAQTPLDSKGPFVQLDEGTFLGTREGATNKFLGIPFGQSTAPPNRFKSPILIEPYTGAYNVSDYGPACPQQDILSSLSMTPSFPPATAKALGDMMNTLAITSGPTSEDCLSLNVFAPANATYGSTLPVLVYLYGGGFAVGGSANYNGTAIVERSLQLGQPTIFVSMNYRVAAWGLIASAEVNAARGSSNLALRDQRLGLQWIQKYISAFGGDPTKVTIWGFSAGAYCAGFHMLFNKGNTEGLFRAVVMESGSAYPPGGAAITQPIYDTLVQDAGCADSKDSLECLAEVDLDILTEAVNKSPNFLQSTNAPWAPRTDNDLIPESPFKAIADGEVADVPYIIGDVEDGGTALALGGLNIRTDSEFREFIKNHKFPGAPDEDIQKMEDLYSSDPVLGAPFGTGTENAVTPQFKRLAAFQTDYTFLTHRRFLLNATANRGSAFSYLIKRNKALPIVGSFHGSELTSIFGGSELQDYLIHFVHGLDPNFGSTLPNWPKYDFAKREMIQFLDGPVPVNTTTDTFREEEIEKMTEMFYKDYPWAPLR